MTATCPDRPAVRPLAAWVLVGLLVAVLVGHGCHGADEDHEPAVALPTERERP